MSDDTVLYELTTKGLAGIHTDVLEITSKGVNYTNRGLASSLAKRDTFIPYDQISSVEVLKLLFGMQYDFSISTTSGKKIKLTNVHQDQAERAKDLIYESQKKLVSSAVLKNVNTNSNTSNIDVADQILKLSKLKDAGILSQEEFDLQKKKILGF
jgi:hypothetical protein